MGTAFSCRENLEDKGIFCQIIVLAHIIILAHIIFMTQSKVFGKSIKNVFCKKCTFWRIIKKIELSILRKRSIMIGRKKFFQD